MSAVNLYLKFRQFLANLIAGAYVWPLLLPIARRPGYLMIGRSLFLKVQASVNVDGEGAVYVVPKLSPSRATSLLKRVHKGQRALKTQHVREVAVLLKTAIHQTIAPIHIDSMGRLTDGGHGLAAIVQSGVTLDSVNIIVVDSSVRKHSEMQVTKTPLLH